MADDGQPKAASVRVCSLPRAMTGLRHRLWPSVNPWLGATVMWLDSTATHPQAHFSLDRQSSPAVLPARQPSA